MAASVCVYDAEPVPRRSHDIAPPAVLTLRAVTSSGDFDDYWRFDLAREHRRLYPAAQKASKRSGPDLPLPETRCTNSDGLFLAH